MSILLTVVGLLCDTNSVENVWWLQKEAQARNKSVRGVMKKVKTKVIVFKSLEWF